jgi:hypothetical protein
MQRYGSAQQAISTDTASVEEAVLIHASPAIVLPPTRVGGGAPVFIHVAAFSRAQPMGR